MRRRGLFGLLLGGGTGVPALPRPGRGAGARPPCISVDERRFAAALRRAADQLRGRERAAAAASNTAATIAMPSGPVLRAASVSAPVRAISTSSALSTPLVCSTASTAPPASPARAVAGRGAR